jgi:hypothetical protein
LRQQRRNIQTTKIMTQYDKGALAPCPPIGSSGKKLVGTLRFAHPASFYETEARRKTNSVSS